MKQFLLTAMVATMWAGAIPALAADGADGGKVQADRQARREQWCKSNPERCGQMKARMEERRKQCEANPAQCRPDKGPKS